MRVQVTGSAITDVERPDHLLSSGTIVAFGIAPPSSATGWPTGFTVTGTAGSRVLKDPHGQILAVEEPTQTAPDAGASGAFTVKGPFALAHDTPGIDTAAGVALWTPVVGDIAAGFDVRIVTPFDAPNYLDIGSYTGLSEDLDTFQIGPGADGIDYSQVGVRWKTFLTTAEVRAKFEVPATAGSLTLRAYVIPAA